jgi:hypothetical protein
MPSLTVPIESIQELKSLDVYDKWLSNMKSQWDTYDRRHELSGTNGKTTKNLILYCFCWKNTPEGEPYWVDIYHKIK